MKTGMKKWLSRFTALFLAGTMLVPGMSAAAAQTESGQGETVLFEDGFESGVLDRWSPKDGAQLSIVTQEPKNGVGCLKISGRTATYAGAKIEIGSMLKAGNLLKASAYVRYEGGPQKKRVQMTMLCDGNYYVLGGAELSKGEWGELKGSVIIPENAKLSGAILYFETPWSANPSQEEDFMDIYVDDARAAMWPFCDTSGYPSLKERYKHEFLVGVAAPDHALNTPVYSDFILRQFNSMTMENEMKPAYILDEEASKSDLNRFQERASLNFQSYKTGMDYALNHGINLRGHTLVWHSQTPDWFFYEDYDVSGALAGRDLMLKRMENYIKDVIAWTETNYPGVIYAWDVVNEAVEDYFGEGPAPMRQENSLWYQTIGEDFVRQAFAFARKYTKEYAPDHTIKLFYNDYNEYFPAKRDGIVKLLKPIKEAGNIDGVGMQSHMDTMQPLEGDRGYMTAVRKFRDELGVEIQVTELDIAIAEGHSQETQGQYYQRLMEALLEEKRAGANITSVTFWGINDDLSWRPGTECLLFSDDLGRKPAFEGVTDAVGAAGETIDKIHEIGTVTASEESKAKIEGARNAYEGLTAKQKQWVSNYSVLEEAEDRYKELSAGGGQAPGTGTDPEKPGTGTENPGTGTEKPGTGTENPGTGTEKPGTGAQTPDKDQGIQQPEIRSIKNAAIKSIPAQIYNGKKKEPFVTVAYGGAALSPGTDYTVSYKNNVNIGTATVTITGKGGYSGVLEAKFQIIVKKNGTYRAGNYKYKITNANTTGKGTVMVTGSTKKNQKSIRVEDTVRIGGVKFKVTAVADAAFQGYKKLSSVTIGKNVTTIGKKSFYQCRKLKKITMKGKALRRVGKNAIKGIHSKAVVKCPKKQLKKYKKLFQASSGSKTGFPAAKNEK